MVCCSCVSVIPGWSRRFVRIRHAIFCVSNLYNFLTKGQECLLSFVWCLHCVGGLASRYLIDVAALSGINNCKSFPKYSFRLRALASGSVNICPSRSLITLCFRLKCLYCKMALKIFLSLFVCDDSRRFVMKRWSIFFSRFGQYSFRFDLDEPF